MQASTEPTRRTRAANATKHPGKPDAPAKRRTPTQKRADDAHQLDIESTKHANALLTLANVASMEDAMETSQTAKRAMTKKPVRPSVKKPIKDGVSAAKVLAAALTTNEDNSPPSQSASAGQPKKPSSGPGMRELLAAGQARRLRATQLIAAAAKLRGMAQPQGDGCDIEPIQSESTNTGHDHKAEALSKVKQWTSRVKSAHAQSNPPASRNPSVSTATSVPQSSVISQSTRATSVNNEDCDGSMDEEPTYGAFGEDGDDHLRHQFSDGFGT